jgi:hypothetical protein
MSQFSRFETWVDFQNVTEHILKWGSFQDTVAVLFLNPKEYCDIRDLSRVSPMAKMVNSLLNLFTRRPDPKVLNREPKILLANLHFGCREIFRETLTEPESSTFHRRKTRWTSWFPGPPLPLVIFFNLFDFLLWRIPFDGLHPRRDPIQLDVTIANNKRERNEKKFKEKLSSWLPVHIAWCTGATLPQSIRKKQTQSLSTYQHNSTQCILLVW